MLSVVLIFSGVTIFAFVGAAVVEAIARGVFPGAERRRRTGDVIIGMGTSDDIRALEDLFAAPAGAGVSF